MCDHREHAGDSHWMLSTKSISLANCKGENSNRGFLSRLPILLPGQRYRLGLEACGCDEVIYAVKVARGERMSPKDYLDWS